MLVHQEIAQEINDDQIFEIVPALFPPLLAVFNEAVTISLRFSIVNATRGFSFSFSFSFLFFSFLSHQLEVFNQS